MSITVTADSLRALVSDLAHAGLCATAAHFELVTREREEQRAKRAELEGEVFRLTQRVDELERHSEALASEVHDLRPYKEAATRAEAERDATEDRLTGREGQLAQALGLDESDLDGVTWEVMLGLVSGAQQALLDAPTVQEVDRLAAERDAAVKRSEEQAAKRLEWSRMARIMESAAHDSTAEVERLTAALRALTEVGESPEGWGVCGDDIVERLDEDEAPDGNGGRCITLLDKGERVEFCTEDAGLDYPAAVILHWADLQRARQAQAALDGAPLSSDGACVPLDEYRAKTAPVAPAEPEVDPRTAVTDRDRENGNPRVCKHCGFARGEHNGYDACPNPGTKAGDWYDPKAYWSATSRYEPNGDAAIEATLRKASNAVPPKRVRATWRGPLHGLKSTTCGVPKRMGDRWSFEGWTHALFTIGEPMPATPGIIAAEIIDEDADTEPEESNR